MHKHVFDFWGQTEFTTAVMVLQIERPKSVFKNNLLNFTTAVKYFCVLLVDFWWILSRNS